ncbi:MAG: flagellar hook-associated protein FlgK [Rhodospirillales bacterium]|nr:flagellar hook-associated protein FlgK [Rhodospirillales bacterium]
MTIGSSLNTALAGLQTASSGIDVTSRNIANANDSGYSRKTQVTSTSVDGAPYVDRVQRAVNAGLQRTSRDAASNVGRLDALSRYASQLSVEFGTPSDATSLSTLTSSLGDTFVALAASPESDTAYTEAVNAAQNLTTSIRGLYQRAQSVATNAENELGEAVSSVNKDLQLINSLNTKILATTNGDTTDLEDQRDQAIANVASMLDITTFTRPDGGVSVYTKNGTALVDAQANTISAQQIAGTGPVQLLVELGAGLSTSAQISPRSGAIKGLLEVINTTVPDIQSQLDSFADTLTTSLNGVGVELFNDGGTTTYDSVSTPSQLYGYANRIAVNSTIVSAPTSIRDGNSATALALGDTTFIDAVVGVFQSSALSFSGPGMSATGSLAGAASGIITGQSNNQAHLKGDLDAEQATQTAIDALISSESGVNLDAEFSHLLELQQAYAANARIVSTTQSLFSTLMVAAGGPAIG